MLIDLHVHSHLTKGCDLDPRAVLERAASLARNARERELLLARAEACARAAAGRAGAPR